MYEQSHRDYLRSGYLHHRLPVSNADHYRDNAITYKAQRDKNARELKLLNAGTTDMQMRQRDVGCARCKIHEGVNRCWEAENDALRMMLPLVVVGCTSAVCQSVREATTPSGVDNAASPDWQTPLNGIISPSERGWTYYAKNNWKEPRSILMSSADRVAHIDGQLMQLL